MSRILEEQIEARINQVYPGWRSDGEWTGKAYSYRSGAQWMQEQMQPEWISVNDRLPEPNQKCLVARIDGNVQVDVFMRLHGGDCHFIYKVTHWMPLPNPPKQ